MKKILVILILTFLCYPALCQVDKKDVRAGNRKFSKMQFKESEIDYRKAALKDSTSLKAQYNLASSLYRQNDYEGAQKALDSVAESGESLAQYHFNKGDVALQKKDYQGAVKAFRDALLLEPNDLDAKENYIYAKKMLENQQQGGDGEGEGNDQNQDQQNDQDKDNQNKDSGDNPQDQPEDQNQDQNQSQEPKEGQISQQQAQQMLKAIQAKEKETQDKVNKEKAAVLKSKQKEKDW